MSKKRIWILCVMVALIIMIGHCIRLNFKKGVQGIPDVVGSISMNRNQYLTVVANRDEIEDKEEFAWKLIEMCQENSFHTIKFSTDRGYATNIHMQVYLWESDIEGADAIMNIDYVQSEYCEKYDIKNNPEKFELYVDGKMIK